MEIEAFVLIGGRSSRMGRDKALIKLDGITLAERAVNKISSALGPERTFLVAADEKQFVAEDLPANIPIIYDQYKDRGAYSGLHAALSAAKSEWIFVFACDLPFVPAKLLKLMAGFIGGNFDAVVPVQPDGRVQPLCAFYRAAPCLRVIEQMLRTDKKLPPLRATFERVRTRFLQFDEVKHLAGAEKFFLNVNTPEDFRQV